MIELRGWVDSGASEPLFSREQDPLPQAEPWTTRAEPQLSLILKQNEGSWGPLCPAARVTLKLHASLHPALHMVPAALRMHHPGVEWRGGTSFPDFCRGTEEEASRTLSVQLSVASTGSTSLLFADEEGPAWLQVCACSLIRRMPLTCSHPGVPELLVEDHTSKPAVDQPPVRGRLALAAYSTMHLPWCGSQKPLPRPV